MRQKVDHDSLFCASANNHHSTKSRKAHNDVSMRCSTISTPESRTCQNWMQEQKAKGVDVSLLRDKCSEQLLKAITHMMSPSVALRPSAKDIVNWEWLRQDLDGQEHSIIGMNFISNWSTLVLCVAWFMAPALVHVITMNSWFACRTGMGSARWRTAWSTLQALSLPYATFLTLWSWTSHICWYSR